MTQRLADVLAGADRRHHRHQLVGHAGQPFLPGTHLLREIRVLRQPRDGRRGLVALQQAQRQFGGQQVVLVFGGQDGIRVTHRLTQSLSRSRLRLSQLRSVFSGTPSRSARSA